VLRRERFQHIESGEFDDASARTTYEEALLDALTTATATDAPTVLIDLHGL